MLSLSVVTLLFASLVSLVPGKKLLVETGSNQAASVEQEEEFGSDYSDYSGPNQAATLNQDHVFGHGGSGNQNANLVGDHAGSGNQVATLYQNRAHASVPKLPSLDVFNNPKQYNTKPKNRVGLADFLYQRSPTTLSEVPFQ